MTANNEIRVQLPEPDGDSVTARDEAHIYLNRHLRSYMWWSNAATIFLPSDLLDAIPGDVLVRLAKERGALVDAGEYAEGDAWREGFTLYKVVES